MSVYEYAEPMKELQLFQIGENHSTKGTLVLLAEDMAFLEEQYNKEHPVRPDGTRVQMPINWNHRGYIAEQAGVPLDEEAQKAAGWFDLEFRSDGIWAVNFLWSEPALKYIHNREYRYLSPEIKRDTNGVIKAFTGLAITNEPALTGIKPVALSKTIVEVNMEETLKEIMLQLSALKEELSVVKGMLEKQMEHELPAAAVESLSTNQQKEVLSAQVVAPKATEQKPDKDELRQLVQEVLSAQAVAPKAAEPKLAKVEPVSVHQTQLGRRPNDFRLVIR